MEPFVNLFKMLTTLLLFCDNSNLKRPFNVNFMLPKALQNIQNSLHKILKMTMTPLQPPLEKTDEMV